MLDTLLPYQDPVPANFLTRNPNHKIYFTKKKIKIWPLSSLEDTSVSSMDGPESSRFDISYQLSLNVPDEEVYLQLRKSHPGVSMCLHIHANDTMTRLYVYIYIYISYVLRSLYVHGKKAKANSRIHSRCAGISHQKYDWIYRYVYNLSVDSPKDAHIFAISLYPVLAQTFCDICTGRSIGGQARITGTSFGAHGVSLRT